MNIQEKSYIFGLLGTDGNLCLQDRNRGKITLEVNSKDRDICEKLFKIIPNSKISERTRNTNFKDNYTSTVFANHQLAIRQELIDFGYPIKDKTNLISIPIQEYSEKDFWRGVIDGDGSLGFISDGSPFLSLVTKSESLKNEYCNFLFKHFGIEKNINRNKRDNVYNITLKNEDAIMVTHFLYDDNVISLDRKNQKAQEMFNWVRTKPKAPARKRWTPEEDKFILEHSIEESMTALKRTEKSIKTRLYRLHTK